MRRSLLSSLTKRSASRPSDIATDANDFKAIQFPIIGVPFNGAPVFVRARELNTVQIKACGDFSMIQTDADKRAESQMSLREMVAYAKLQHNIVRESIVEPSYDEIMEVVAFDADWRRRELGRLRELVKSTPRGKEQDALLEDIDKLRVQLDLVLPQDFCGSIMAFALRSEKSDIRRVSEDMLVDAAILAKRSGKAPHEYLEGQFTPFNRLDIDARAWYLFDRKVEEQKRGRRGG